MNALPLGPDPSLIEDAIARHGPSRVLLAALRALLRPAARPPDRPRPPRARDLRDLNEHLRRDIGLPPRM